MAEEKRGTPVQCWDAVNGNHEEVNALVRSEARDNAQMSMGERFQNLRGSTGMNRKEFAEWLDIPYRTMQDWERNVATMPAYVFALIEYKVQHEFPELKESERPKDPNALGNQMRGIEDQLEQNDNQLDGIINNLPTETVAEKEAKTSVREKLKATVPEREHRPVSLCPDRELC